MKQLIKSKFTPIYKSKQNLRLKFIYLRLNRVRSPFKKYNVHAK